MNAHCELNLMVMVRALIENSQTVDCCPKWSYVLQSRKGVTGLTVCLIAHTSTVYLQECQPSGSLRSGETQKANYFVRLRWNNTLLEVMSPNPCWWVAACYIHCMGCGLHMIIAAVEIRCSSTSRDLKLATIKITTYVCSVWLKCSGLNFFQLLFVTIYLSILCCRALVMRMQVNK